MEAQLKFKNISNDFLVSFIANSISFETFSVSTDVVKKILDNDIEELDIELKNSKLTFKNDYINFSIKYIGRILIFIIAIIFNYKILYIIDICTTPTINRLVFISYYQNIFVLFQGSVHLFVPARSHRLPYRHWTNGAYPYVSAT